MPKGEQERDAAARTLLAFVSKVSGTPWHEEQLADAEDVVDIIARAIAAKPTDHERAVDAERKKRR
jgi:hypothetical protein